MHHDLGVVRMVWSSSAAGCGRYHDEPRRRIDDDDLFARYCEHVAGWFQPVFVVPRILEIVPVPTGVVETPVGLLRSTSRHMAPSGVPRHYHQSWDRRPFCSGGWNSAKSEGENPSSPSAARDKGVDDGFRSDHGPTICLGNLCDTGVAERFQSCSRRVGSTGPRSRLALSPARR